MIAALSVATALAALPPYQSQTLSYAYDSLGRVITVSYSDGSVSTYVYDAAGNRTAAAVSGASLSTDATSGEADHAKAQLLIALTGKPAPESAHNFRS